MTFDAIIFDFDGVIVDSEPLANRILAERLTAIGLPTTEDEALARYCGHRWSDCVAMIEARLGDRLPADFVDGVNDESRAVFLETLPAIDGVGDFVRAHAHRAQAIASSSEPEWLDLCLDKIGLAAHFHDRVFSAAALERGKPHPDVYLMVADRLGVSPARALVVEDSVTGVKAAAAAGMRVVGLLAGGHIADHHPAALVEAGAHHLANDYPALDRLIAELES